MTPLQELADAVGIELTRPAAGGSSTPVPDETLLVLCRALGSDVARPEDALEALALASCRSHRIGDRARDRRLGRRAARHSRSTAPPIALPTRSR